VPEVTSRKMEVEKRVVSTKAIPTYKKSTGGFVAESSHPKVQSWAEKTKDGNEKGFKVVVGKVEKKKVSKKLEVVKKEVAPESERHLKIRFVGKRGVKHALPEGVI